MLTRDKIDALAAESRFGLEGWWARFWAKVDEVSGHYLWRGAKVITIGGRKFLPAEVAYVYLYDDLGEGVDAACKCGHADCVRHLRPVLRALLTGPRRAVPPPAALLFALRTGARRLTPVPVALRQGRRPLLSGRHLPLPRPIRRLLAAARANAKRGA
ncbi:MAG: hypothetical protein ACYC8T_32065 [Myxococcaceae bacterium]